MSDTLNEIDSILAEIDRVLTKDECEDKIGVKVRSGVFLKDNTMLSIQASRLHNCSPNTIYGNHTEFEVSCESKDFPELEEYQDGSIFSYVPVDELISSINRHGGIDVKKTIEQAKKYDRMITDGIEHRGIMNKLDNNEFNSRVQGNTAPSNPYDDSNWDGE